LLRHAVKAVVSEGVANAKPIRARIVEKADVKLVAHNRLLRNLLVVQVVDKSFQTKPLQRITEERPRGARKTADNAFKLA
jgi:hypothetical protein